MLGGIIDVLFRASGDVHFDIDTGDQANAMAFLLETLVVDAEATNRVEVDCYWSYLNIAQMKWL